MKKPFFTVVLVLIGVHAAMDGALFAHESHAPSLTQEQYGVQYDAVRDRYIDVQPKKRPFSNLDSVFVGGFPSPDGATRGLTFDGTYLWSADNGDGNSQNGPMIYKLDASTGAILGSFTAPGDHYPCGLTWDGAYLWHCDFGVDMVYKIDTTTMNVIKSFTAPGGGIMIDMAFDGQNLYGSIGNNDHILGFDTSGAVTDSVHATYSSGNVAPFGLVHLASGNNGELWASDGNYGSNMMNIWDFETSSWVDQWATNPASYPCGLAYDPLSGYLWVSCWHNDSIYIFDVGPAGPVDSILFVADDPGASYDTLWDASFSNLGYPFDKWVVADSGDVAPDSAVLSAYTIVVWTTGDEYTSTLTGTDTLELGKWLATGGKLWLSSQDVLFDLGTTISWMHLSGHNSDMGCDSCMGIGPVMSGTDFFTTGGIFNDFTDHLIPDGSSWAELNGDDHADTTAVAIDTSSAVPYFLFFNAFGWENISTSADRDTMMERILTWMGFPPLAVEELPGQQVVFHFDLNRISPNPVASQATIAYTTAAEGPVSLKIYDASGRLVRTLVDAKEDAGRKTVTWDGKDNNNHLVSAGVYFYRLTADGKTASRKMVVVR